MEKTGKLLFSIKGTPYEFQAIPESWLSVSVSLNAFCALEPSEISASLVTLSYVEGERVVKLHIWK